MFINFTNHPSTQWSAEQKAAAQVYGKVIDLAFPAIDPATNEAVLDSLAAVYADHILHLSPDAVLCQGECTFVYRVVQRLEAAGIPTLAACSRRKSQETTYPDGSTLKRSIFAFAASAAMAHPERGFSFYPPRHNNDSGFIVVLIARIYFISIKLIFSGIQLFHFTIFCDIFSVLSP